MLVSGSNGEKVIADFNEQGAVGLLNTFAVMAREGDPNQSVTLAPMPFPQQKNQLGNLQESSSSAYIYSTSAGPRLVITQLNGRIGFEKCYDWNVAK